MTKEEALDFIIQKYKNNVESLDDVRVAYCDEIKWNCLDCPFNYASSCESAIAEKFMERFIKAEQQQHQKTNLKHYIYVEYMDDDVFRAILEPSAVGDFNKSDSDDFYKWLLAPYEEPPKPKYKLSKFEYDLLKCYSGSLDRIANHWALCRMHEKGYFKDIPSNMSIGDILDNCEVVEE